MGYQFSTTSWSQIIAAREGASTDSREALEGLCEAYWYPVYAFVRLQGYDPESARDLTQSYFAELLEKDYLDDVDPSLGRFRAFLKGSIKHFLSNERRKEHTLKRGGGAQVVSLDIDDAEGYYRVEPVDDLTPDEIFERRWALTILERVLEKLREEFIATGKRKEFDQFQAFITGEQPRTPYRDVASALGISEGAVKASVHRLRGRFGKLLREEIAETVANPDLVDDEVRHLLAGIAPWEARPA